ncbi:MAG: hypothetical protein LBO09_06415 [Candidatus Peribacteria bacterium]|jgi:hypothetical protein|nr:hypothetical protein [Candidatus Peribacteria bacterium]
MGTEEILRITERVRNGGKISAQEFSTLIHICKKRCNRCDEYEPVYTNHSSNTRQLVSYVSNGCYYGGEIYGESGVFCRKYPKQNAPKEALHLLDLLQNKSPEESIG